MSRAEGNGRAISTHALQAAVFLTQKYYLHWADVDRKTERRKERDIWSNMADGWGWGRWQELSKASSQC